jgi:hypothetical protein
MARSRCSASPRIRFLFVGPRFRSSLLSAPPRGWSPCDSLGVATTGSPRGLSPPSHVPCWAHHGFFGAERQKINSLLRSLRAGLHGPALYFGRASFSLEELGRVLTRRPGTCQFPAGPGLGWNKNITNHTQPLGNKNITTLRFCFSSSHQAGAEGAGFRRVRARPNSLSMR